MKNYSCANCRIINCKHQDLQNPKFCPTKELTTDEMTQHEELEEKKKTIKGTYKIQRFKGLGEMNSDELYETTMCPETRSLIKVSITDAALAEKRVSVLMGDKVEPRKEWINENVDFTLEDSFRKE